MPYSILYGLSIAQIREDFPTAREALQRLEALRGGSAVGIIIFDKSDTEISGARLAELAGTEGDGD